MSASVSLTAGGAPELARPRTRRVGRALAAVAVGIMSGAAGILAPVLTAGSVPAAAVAPRNGSVSSYWLVASDGGIFSFGGAPFYGSAGGIRLNRPVVGMAGTPGSGGYWLVASDGGIFTYGNAGFFGSTGALKLNQPVVGMAATPDGGGYWLVASDGGIFSFGDAPFYGSTGGIHLNKPIVGMAPTPDGHGYWFTASDGGVFTFGDAPFFGSLGSVPQQRPVVAMASSADGGGYWFTNNNGLVSAFGDATYWGSAPQVLNRPVVGMAQADAAGVFTGSSYQSGSFGYDISNYQCGGFLPPSPHAVGIVEVVGQSMGGVNPCLGQEAQWAGGGLNLYAFLTFGQDPSSPDQACNGTANPTACNFGFDTALDAFHKAGATPGVNAAVPWWLDVESGFSADQGANASLVQGAIDGLHYVGLNSVGIYASPGIWNTIVGSYAPPVPYWAAWWQHNPADTCANVRAHFPGASLPTGPVQVVQYSSPSASLSVGGMDTAFDDDYAC